MNYRDDYDYIHSTYLDNDLLDERIKKSIEQRKNNQNWWKVYGRGEIGQLEGVVFHNWQQIDKYPDDLKWEIYGLDFGYSNDPTTIIRIGFKEGKLYLDEMLYQTGLTNNEIAGFIKNKIGRATIIADSAEPKSIEEIYRHGIDIRGAEKGKDSILFGIDLLQECHMKVTKRSINIIKELRNYTWDKDKNGKQLNKPIDMFNHGIDALRYAATYKLRKKRNLYEPV
jgi:phage terminase large subunit